MKTAKGLRSYLCVDKFAVYGVLFVDGKITLNLEFLMHKTAIAY